MAAASSSRYPPSSQFDSDDESGEESSEGDEESSSEEEEQEPKLKYQRLGAAVNEILKTDKATAMAVHSKFLVLGTNDGTVTILDFNGNKTESFRPHTNPITELSIDSTGEYVGCCSINGKVVIYGLYSKEVIQESYRSPINCLALDPDFARRDTRQFVCGGKDGRLVLNTKGFFGFLGTRNVVLYSGDGPIYAVKWRGSMIAWADNHAVKVYDHSLEERISFIERPKNSPRPDQYRCNLCWETPTKLIVGWADCIKIAQVKERPPGSSGPSKTMDILTVIQTEYFISGIAPFQEYLVVLAYISENGRAQYPELRVIDRKNEDISSDALTIKDFEQNKTNDYRLDALFEEGIFYVVSPHDIVVAKPCDLDDKIGWLLQRERYEEALAAAEAQSAFLKTHQLSEIGQKYLLHLVNNGEINKAASLCPKILGKDPRLWDKWVFHFGKFGELKAIAQYVPIANPKLSEMAYEIILNDFLKHDPHELVKLINAWPPTLYNTDNIIKAVDEIRRTTNDASILSDALAKLYTLKGNYGEALNIGLRLKRGDVFNLIKQHNLIDRIADKVVQLIEFDSEQAIELLVDASTADDSILPVSKVVEQLSDPDQELWKHRYLFAVYERDSQCSPEYDEMRVELIAKYQRDALAKFLNSSVNYSPERAQAVCEQYGLFKEMIEILKNIGNPKLALRICIDKLGDIKEAIDICASEKDDELWDELLTHAMSKSEYVSELLEHIGSHMPLKTLLEKIPEDIEIPRLRDRLGKIIADNNLQRELHKGCSRILVSDSVTLIDKLVRQQRKGVRISNQSNCPLCNGPIIGSDRESGGVVALLCRHFYHLNCLKSSMSSENSAAPNPSAASSTDTSSVPSTRWEPLRNQTQPSCPICQTTQKKRKTLAQSTSRRGAASSSGAR